MARLWLPWSGKYGAQQPLDVLGSQTHIQQLLSLCLSLVVEIQLPHYTMLELLHTAVKHPSNSPDLSSKQFKSDCKHAKLVSV